MNRYSLLGKILNLSFTEIINAMNINNASVMGFIKKINILLKYESRDLQKIANLNK